MNDDLISRQAAIDAIERNAYRHTYIDQIVDIIKELPSAQPEIIRCKDCIFHGLCRTSPKWAVAPKRRLVLCRCRKEYRWLNI